MIKKQNQKRIIILSCVVLALILAIVLVLWLTKDDAPPPTEPKAIMVCDLNANSVFKIQYTYQGKQIVLEQDNGIWKLIDQTDPDIENFPLNTNFLISTSDRSMTAKCAKLILERRVLEGGFDKATYGLDQPTISITYQTNEVVSTTQEDVVVTRKVHIGKTYDTLHYYCMIEVEQVAADEAGNVIHDEHNKPVMVNVQDNSLYLISADFYHAFAVTKDDLANRGYLPGVEKDLILSYAYADSTGTKNVTSFAGITAIYDKLQDLDFGSFADYKTQNEAERAEYGVAWDEAAERKAERILSIVYYSSQTEKDKATDPETEEAERPKPSTYRLIIGKTESGKTYYRKYNDVDVYQIEQTFFSELLALFDTYAQPPTA